MGRGTVVRLQLGLLLLALLITQQVYSAPTAMAQAASTPGAAVTPAATTPRSSGTLQSTADVLVFAIFSLLLHLIYWETRAEKHFHFPTHLLQRSPNGFWMSSAQRKRSSLLIPLCILLTQPWERHLGPREGRASEGFDQIWNLPESGVQGWKETERLKLANNLVSLTNQGLRNMDF